ncbi:hypothetical protein FACS1894204_11740 [Synergistales bacterium]|nr:hypothetical protein FACS1894204_11740 [Synergistales bacterium]
MYPVLFRVAGISIETYYVIWYLALSIMLQWIMKRLPIYGIDMDDGVSVLRWAFLGMLLGARGFEYVWNFRAYWNDPSLFLDFGNGGLSEVGALFGATLTAFILCRNNPKVSFSGLCDAAAIPAVFAVTFGRWGCFFAGCCVGIESSSPFALHFPYDALDVTRHSTQIYYSLFAFLILTSLFLLEKWSLKRCLVTRQARFVLAPVVIILGSVMRFVIDPLRADSAGGGFFLSHVVLAAATALSVAWVCVSVKALLSGVAQSADS